MNPKTAKKCETDKYVLFLLLILFSQLNIFSKWNNNVTKTPQNKAF